MIFEQTHVSDPDLGASQHLSRLGFDIADNRVGGDPGEIGDVAVNRLISWRTIDTLFSFCGLSASKATGPHQLAAYSNGSMTIEPVVLRPPMNLCAAAASRSGKVLTTLLATTPCATASNRDFAAASSSLRVDM